MGNIAVRAENLSKQYRFGAQQNRNMTLRETLMSAVRSPFSRFRPSAQRDENTFWALNDVSFEIKHGEAVGIIGRNGAGKSTLLKILSRITKPTRGRVEMYGRVGSLLEVGTGFHSELSGRENIYLNGAILGMSRRDINRKFDEIVAFAETEKFLDTPVKYYSSGMYVRLAFAVAAHLEPEILIVDEVLAVGDAEFQKKCLGKMEDVAQGGRTVLFVSHNLNTIRQLCNTCILLDKGQVAQSGNTRDVVQGYLSSGNADKASVEIPIKQHIHNPLGLRFCSAEIRTKGNLTNHIPYENSFEITCEFEITEAIGGTRVGMVVSTDEGLTVSTIHYPDLQDDSEVLLEPGKYIWNVIIDMPLMPGGYVIDLFAKPWPGYWGSGHASLDWIQGALIFHIKETNEDGSKFIHRSGIVAPKYVSKISNV